jgi:hypothetical protein
MAERIIRVEVVDVDTVRAERLTRALKRELDTVDGLSVAYADPGSRPAAGAKGDVLPAILEVAAVGVWPFAAPLLAEAVKSWLHREGRARVRITVGPDHVEIEGDPSAGQEKLLLALLTGQAEE